MEQKDMILDIAKDPYKHGYREREDDLMDQPFRKKRLQDSNA